MHDSADASWRQATKQNGEPMIRQSDIIQAILKDGNYRLDLFCEDEIAALREKVGIESNDQMP